MTLRTNQPAALGGQPPLSAAADHGDEFLALAGHELRAPLAVILASVEVLLAADMTPEVADRLRVIGAEASRMARLLESLLDVSRAGNGEGVLETTALDAEAVCREAAQRAAALHGGRQWRVCVAPATPPVLAHPDRLQLVLDNLLQNAAKYSSAGSAVEVAAAATDDRRAVCFSVSDRGPGVPQEQAGHVFEPYRRLAPGEMAAGGHGLGLYLARKIVELQGGRIWMESAPDRGTRVRFTVPAADADT